MTSLLDPLKISRGCISAPAGCGKTHLISHSISAHSDEKPILVLTHTNAGVAALKKRLDRLAVRADRYRLATIDGWAIRLISTFPMRSCHDPNILELKRPARDYSLIKVAAHRLLKSEDVNDVIKASYSRLFVDEYQDCMKEQHEIIVQLARQLPTCIFGDRLQCIFDWSGTKPDWDRDVLVNFPLQGELDVPYRWKNAGTEELGRWLLDIRKPLSSSQSIDLATAPKEVQWVQLNGSNDDDRKREAALSKSPVAGGSVLIICAGINKSGQIEIAKCTPGAFVVEAVDLSDFVKFAERFNFDDKNATASLIDFAAKMMTGVDASRLKARLLSLEKGTARTVASDVEMAALSFKVEPTPKNANALLVELNKQSGSRAHRPALLAATLRALWVCESSEDFADHAVAVREQQRVVGREIKGRAVGSTLLLKGLEADVAVVLDTDEMKAEDLYVALTRGARKLVVCSKSQILSPKGG